MDETRDPTNRQNRLKILATLVVLFFVVTLALVIGNRLSDEALSVLAGAVCGVGAAMPTSLLIVAISRRRDEPQTRSQTAQETYPPVVIVTPPGGHQQLSDWQGSFSPCSPMAAPIKRQFTVVGERPLNTEVMVNERYS